MADFVKFAEEARKFYLTLAATLHSPDDIEKAKKITKEVFITLRQSISNEASILLLNELPMVLKGIYAEGWDMAQKTDKTESLKDFIKRMADNDRKSQATTTEQEIFNENTLSVFRTLFHFLPNSDLKNWISALNQSKAFENIRK